MAHDAERILVLWKKGQNFFSSFFAEVSNVRKEINDNKKFLAWCWDELGLPLATIMRISDVLTLADAARVKAELASAKAAEQEQRRRDREYRELVAAHERKRKEDEKAAAAAEKVRQEEQTKATDKLARKRASKKKNNAGWAAKKRADYNKALAKVASTNVVPFRNSELAEKTEGQLVRQIKAAIARCETSRAEWIDASVDLAGLLCEARVRYPADQRFSTWLNENDINLNADDRAALLKLGQNTEAMRVILGRTESRSYQMIWRDTQKQITSVS